MKKKVKKSQRKKTRKKKTNNFNFTRKNNPERKYVDGIKPPWWNYNKKNNEWNELSEKSLHHALYAFLKDDCDINSDKKKLKGSEYIIFPDYTVTPKDSNKSFTAWDEDLNRPVPIEGIIFEYDGDKHYYSMMKIESDNIKMDEIKRLKYRRIRIPFYYQLTIDIAKFIFDDLMFHFTGKKYFSEKRYYEAIKKIYRDPISGKSLEKLSTDDLKKKDYPVVHTPGMQLTEYVPATYHDDALRRVVHDFQWKSPRPGAESKGFPESAKHQFFRSLQLYIKDTKNSEHEERKHLILPIPNPKRPGHQKSYYANQFMEEYENFEKQPVQEHFKKVFYLREEYRNLYEKYIYEPKKTLKKAKKI